MAETTREAYMEWLKSEVEKHCNRDGLFEVYWDYRDSISPNDILEAAQGYADMGYTTPDDYLEELVLGDKGESDFYANYLLPDLDDAPEEVQDGWYASQSIWDDLEEAGYRGIDANLGQLLRHSDFKVNVFFATEAERNHDFASIVDSFGNDYRDPRLEHVEAEDLDNALSYLVNQQGHSVAELYSPLPEGKGDSPFIESVRQEISENSSEAMSNLAVLLRMDGNEMLRFLDARDKGERSLMLPKDYATVGIFNQWSGCGGVLDIQLEKDAVLPLSMAWDFSIEGNGSSNRWGGYTVDEVYGLVGSMWQSSFGFVTSLQPAVREDYALALEQARAAAKSRDEAARQEEPRPSLKDAAEQSRASCGALSGGREETAPIRDEQVK